MTRLSESRKQATIRLIENFLDKMGRSLDHIDNELAYTTHNVYPSTTLGDGSSRSTGTRSPVERLVIDSRQRLRDDEAQLWDDYNAICSIALSGSRTAEKASGERVPHPDIARCNHGSGKALEGFTLWQDINCQRFPGNNPIIEGMCDDCAATMNEWRATNGYERIVRDAESRTYRRDMAARNVRQGPDGRFQRAE
jgi:hypothetical protein